MVSENGFGEPAPRSRAASAARDAAIADYVNARDAARQTSDGILLCGTAGQGVTLHGDADGCFKVIAAADTDVIKEIEGQIRDARAGRVPLPVKPPVERVIPALPASTYAFLKS